MITKSVHKILACLALIVLVASVASAQTGELRGHVVLVQADGQKVPVSDAVIDVYRTDIKGEYHTKTDKKGQFVFAGLPYVGTFTVAVSHATAQPTWQPNIKAGRGTDFEFTLSPGDGRRLTLAEVEAAAKQSGGASSGAGESASEKAKREELLRKNAEIEAGNKKVEESNALINRTFKAGNEAIGAKKYDEAIAQFDEGLRADPDHPAIPSLLTNKSVALRARGIDRYNAAIKMTDEAAKKAGLEAAKQDWQAAAEASTKAVTMLKAQPSAPGAVTAPGQKSNLYYAQVARAEAMKLFVPKVDPTQVDQGAAAFEEYIAAESDPAKKTQAERDLAQMLFDANSFERALTQYQKILSENPDDLDALLRSGQALFNIGAIDSNKAKYQEAANFLAKFVEKAPDTNAFKEDAKAILAALKDQENVKPEKIATPPPRRRRP